MESKRVLERKELVLQVIEKNPGIRFNEIMRVTNMKNGTLSHYVKKLEDGKHIQLERSPRVTRLYPSSITKEEAEICKYLSISTQKKILVFILENKIVTSIQIREHIKKSPSVVSVNLNVLFKAKIINKKYDIPSNKFTLKNPGLIRDVLNEYYPDWINERESIKTIVA